MHFIFHPFQQVLIFTFGSSGTAVIVLAAVFCDYRSRGYGESKVSCWEIRQAAANEKHWSRDPQGWPVLRRRHPDSCWQSHCYGNWEMTPSKVYQYRISLMRALTNLWFGYSASTQIRSEWSDPPCCQQSRRTCRCLHSRPLITSHLNICSTISTWWHWSSW